MIERAPVRCAIWGTGRMGAECTRAALARGDLQPVAAIVTDARKEGRDLGEICGLGMDLGAVASTDVGGVLAREDIDLVFVCGFSDSEGIAAMMRQAAEAGKDAITYSGLIHPATALRSEGARELDRVARRNGARLLGTGWAGFFTDALPVALTTLSVDWSSIVVTVIQGMDAWGDYVLDAYGIGRPPAAISDNSDRLSPLESVGMIADALGVDVERSEVRTEPILAQAPVGGSRSVQPGMVRGVRKLFSVATTDGRSIVLAMTFVFGLAESAEFSERYVIDVEGVSPGSGVHAELSGGWSPDPYPSTAACGTNAVHGLRSLPPGLYSMAQVPRAVRREDWPSARPPAD